MVEAVTRYDSLMKLGELSFKPIDLRITTNSSPTTTKEDDDSDAGQSDDSDDGIEEDDNGRTLKNLVDGLDPRLRQKVMMGRKKGSEPNDEDR